MTLFNRLSAELKRRQSPARYRHSLAVARFAAELGRLHGWDPERARLTGLLHDWAKEWPPAELIAYVRRHRLPIPGMKFILKTSPNLLHAYVSADVARRERWLRHPADLRAIASHTLGSARMDVPAKILYVADLASPGRAFREALGIRREVRADLHRGFAAALSLKLSYQLRKRRPIHPLPLEVWNRVVGRLPASLLRP